MCQFPYTYNKFIRSIGWTHRSNADEKCGARICLRMNNNNKHRFYRDENEIQSTYYEIHENRIYCVHNIWEKMKKNWSPKNIHMIMWLRLKLTVYQLTNQFNGAQREKEKEEKEAQYTGKNMLRRDLRAVIVGIFHRLKYEQRTYTHHIVKIISFLCCTCGLFKYVKLRIWSFFF